MKKLVLGLAVGLFSLALTAFDAQAAKRLGGGKSSGMQRESVTQRQATPPQQQHQQAAAPASAPQPAAQPKRSWLGPLAGLAAGLGLGWLLSQGGFGEAMTAILFGLAAVFAVMLLVRLFRRPQPARESGLQYAGVGAPTELPPQYAQSAGSAASPEPAAAAAAAIPAGFDVEGFLRVAKLNFVRLQAANDTKNLDDMREFVTPEMFAEIKLQMDERGAAPQQTNVVTLNADLLEVVTEGSRHIASVRFSGMIGEDANAAPEAFTEVWNLAKPADGSHGWMVAGIQQLQ